MSMARAIKRAYAKREQGNSHIAKAWQAKQITKYGFKDWWYMRVDCDPKRRRASTLAR